MTDTSPVKPEGDAALPFGEMTTRDDMRQQARMPNGYRPLSIAGAAFDTRLAFEIALQMDPPGDVFNRYGYDELGAKALIANPIFQGAVKAYSEDIKANGISFRLKAQVAAEDLLEHAYDIATNAEVSPAVRADLIKWHAKVSGLEPKEDGKTGGGGNGYALQIVFSGQQPAVTVGRQPVTIEGERV